MAARAKPRRSQRSSKPKQHKHGVAQQRTAKQSPTKAAHKAGSAGPRRRSQPDRPKLLTLPKLVWIVLGSPLLAGATLLGGLFLWAKQAGTGSGQLVSIHLAAGSIESVSHELHARGLVDSPWLFWGYVVLLKPGLEFEAGEHLLLDSLAPRDLAAQLARLPSRASVKVTLLEGWTHLDMGKRLEQRGVCTLAAFVEAVQDSELLERLGLVGLESAEGYLFPDTYDLHLDSTAEAVVVTLVQQAKQKLKALGSEHRAALTRLVEAGYDEHEWIIFASILEKEAIKPEELPSIASVFFNRLKDPSFRPQRMLQSDPTAAYGCRVEPERARSCDGFEGSVRPEMLRDADNRYNTYKHPGLPPGPISNPGQKALLAVLEPQDTPYLFFFADGKGGHTFTRTFEEHRAAIRGRSQH